MGRHRLETRVRELVAECTSRHAALQELDEEERAKIAEVLEVHTITGAGDLFARVVACSNADLQRVIDRVLAHPAITRSSTVIALATQVGYRTLPLARAATATAAAGEAAEEVWRHDSRHVETSLFTRLGIVVPPAYTTCRRSQVCGAS